MELNLNENITFDAFFPNLSELFLEMEQDFQRIKALSGHKMMCTKGTLKKTQNLSCKPRKNKR